MRVLVDRREIERWPIDISHRQWSESVDFLFDRWRFTWRPSLVIVLLVFAAKGLTGELRTWTSSTGAYKIEAELLDLYSQWIGSLEE